MPGDFRSTHSGESGLRRAIHADILDFHARDLATLPNQKREGAEEMNAGFSPAMASGNARYAETDSTSEAIRILFGRAQCQAKSRKIVRIP